MPELPEVETVVRDLRPLLVGRKFQSVEQGEQKLRRPWNQNWTTWLKGQKVQVVRRRGKWIIIDFEKPSLLLHLGMTGQLTVEKQSTPRQDHTHLIFPLDNQHELRFRDVRRFGSADAFANSQELQLFLDDKLGPEPFDMTPVQFQEAVQSSVRNLKAILLDQAIIAGVGNIYADEACFHSQLRPTRKGKSLKPADCDRLLAAIQYVLNRAIEGRGSTIKDYIGGSGLMGTYQGEFRVYGRTGEACDLCQQAIVMERLAGRSSHYCKKCQR